MLGLHPTPFLPREAATKASCWFLHCCSGGFIGKLILIYVWLYLNKNPEYSLLKSGAPMSVGGRRQLRAIPSLIRVSIACIEGLVKPQTEVISDISLPLLVLGNNLMDAYFG